jgi:hypothetical protein
VPERCVEGDRQGSLTARQIGPQQFLSLAFAFLGELHSRGGDRNGERLALYFNLPLQWLLKFCRHDFPLKYLRADSLSHGYVMYGAYTGLAKERRCRVMI